MKPLSAARFAKVIGLALVGFFVCLVLAPLIGKDSAGFSLLPLGEVWSGAFGERSVGAQIFFIDRLPRALAGAVVGAGLAGAGCAFQAVLRNPLAEPFTLGISSGSSLAAVIAIRLGIDASFLGPSAIGLAALVGALASVYIVWRLGQDSVSHSPATLLLAGITIAMFCSAASMLVQYTANFSEVYRIVRWMMGGLDWIQYGAVVRVAVVVVIGGGVLLWYSRDLNAMAAGGDAAASVGTDARRVGGICLGAASLMVGAGIAIAGPIGFIGLMVPHALRALIGPDHRLLVPASMLMGAAALVACDTLARTIIGPAQLPVGVVTALFGGPFFLYLLLRKRSRARLWGG